MFFGRRFLGHTLLVQKQNHHWLTLIATLALTHYRKVARALQKMQVDDILAEIRRLAKVDAKRRFAAA